MKWALIMSGYKLVAYQWNFKERKDKAKRGLQSLQRVGEVKKKDKEKENKEEDIGEEEKEKKGGKETNIKGDSADKPVWRPTCFSGTTPSCGLGM